MSDEVVILKEIGGYFELQRYTGKEYYRDAIALNRAANCLAYLIKAKGITKLYIPYFLCRAIKNTCVRCNCDYEYYSIDKTLKSVEDFDLKENEYFYIVDYYGQLSKEDVGYYKKKYRSIIIDAVQDFFAEPFEQTDTLYSCRKYFGVSDGAYLYTDALLDEKLETDISYERMKHILGRYEETAQKFYNDYTEAEKAFADWPIKHMSKLTHNLLRGIDYDFVKTRRKENFEYLHSKLKNINRLELTVPDGAFMYPLYVENGAELKKKLIANKIFVPTLWADVYDVCNEGTLEYDFAKNIVPLPVDQRYSVEDMKYILEVLHV